MVDTMTTSHVAIQATPEDRAERESDVLIRCQTLRCLD